MYHYSIPQNASIKLANKITSPFITTAKASALSNQYGATITIEPEIIAQVNSIICKILLDIVVNPIC